VDTEPELDPARATPEEELAVSPELDPELEPEGDPEPDPEPELELDLAPELLGVPGLVPPPELEPPAALEPPPLAPLAGELGSGGIGCGFRSHPCGIARKASASASATFGRRGMP